MAHGTEGRHRGGFEDASTGSSRFAVGGIETINRRLAGGLKLRAGRPVADPSQGAHPGRSALLLGLLQHAGSRSIPSTGQGLSRPGRLRCGQRAWAAAVSCRQSAHRNPASCRGASTRPGPARPGPRRRLDQQVPEPQSGIRPRGTRPSQREARSGRAARFLSARQSHAARQPRDGRAAGRAIELSNRLAGCAEVAGCRQRSDGPGRLRNAPSGSTLQVDQRIFDCSRRERAVAWKPGACHSPHPKAALRR